MVRTRYISSIFTLLLLLTCGAAAQTAGSSPIGFKGLNLGMTQAEVEQMVGESNGAWEIAAAQTATPDVMILTAQDDEEHTSAIGCAESDSGEKCYNFESIVLEYDAGKVYRITINSPRYGVDLIEHDLREWGEMAGAGLAQKYGEPTQTYELTDEMLEEWKDGECLFIVEWTTHETVKKKKVEKERIRLRMCQIEGAFMYDVTIEDVQAAVKAERAEGKVKGKF